MRLVIHPGLPKCGSTTIQSYLSANREKLQEQGVAAVPTEPALTLDIPAVFESGIADALLENQMSETATVVVSHESFIDRAKKPVVQDFLEKMVGVGFQPRVVLVTRPLGDWVLSNEIQRLKGLKGSPPNQTYGVERWFATWMSPQTTALLDAPPAVIDLKSATGLIEQFFSAAGLEHVELPPSPPGRAVNRSPRGRDLALYVVVNDCITAAFADVEQRQLALRDVRMSHVRKLLNQVLSMGDHHRQPKDLGIDAGFRDQLIDHLLGDLGDALDHVAGSPDPRRSKRIASGIKAARSVLFESAKGKQAAEDAEQRFLASVAEVLPAIENSFVTWCQENDRLDVLGMMVPARGVEDRSADPGSQSS